MEAVFCLCNFKGLSCIVLFAKEYCISDTFHIFIDPEEFSNLLYFGIYIVRITINIFSLMHVQGLY